MPERGRILQCDGVCTTNRSTSVNLPNNPPWDVVGGSKFVCREGMGMRVHGSHPYIGPY